LLQKYVKQRLIINQLQLSLTNTGMINRGLNVNMENPPSVDRDGGILEYCRLENITIQPWSPFQHGFFEGPFIGNKKYPELNKELTTMAKKYGITVEALAIAWILRHPANMQPIIGTTKVERVKAISEAYNIKLTREEWYSLYRSAGNELP
jgi:predicted oxidoreductase